ncbi:hypothetical protein BIW11_02881 [Tropilaelaps mercedesae]|uniref:Uncharacterized protein n=1 Tax=Tropilaelaps mercedesae TaxID=418985 RepID=A0A1V9XVV3_9ACAR|nr:hypothetical protein BIW11_02881 [Tropilaelaps mercedesae]
MEKQGASNRRAMSEFRRQEEEQRRSLEKKKDRGEEKTFRLSGRPSGASQRRRVDRRLDRVLARRPHDALAGRIVASGRVAPLSAGLCRPADRACDCRNPTIFAVSEVFCAPTSLVLASGSACGVTRAEFRRSQPKSEMTPFGAKRASLMGCPDSAVISRRTDARRPSVSSDAAIGWKRSENRNVSTRFRARPRGVSGIS